MMLNIDLFGNTGSLTQFYIEMLYRNKCFSLEFACAESASEDPDTIEIQDPEHIDKSLVEKLNEQYMKSTQYSKMQEALTKIEANRGEKKKKKLQSITYATSFLNQLYWVTNRSCKNLVRNPQASVAQVQERLQTCRLNQWNCIAVFYRGVSFNPHGKCIS